MSCKILLNQNIVFLQGIEVCKKISECCRTMRLKQCLQFVKESVQLVHFFNRIGRTEYRGKKSRFAHHGFKEREYILIFTDRFPSRKLIGKINNRERVFRVECPQRFFRTHYVLHPCAMFPRIRDYFIYVEGSDV